MEGTVKWLKNPLFATIAVVSMVCKSQNLNFIRANGKDHVSDVAFLPTPNQNRHDEIRSKPASALSIPRFFPI